MTRNITRRSVAMLALTLAGVIGISACSPAEVVYSNGRQNEVEHSQSKETKGDIETSINTPVTMEDLAQLKQDDIGSVLDTGTNGILVANEQFTKLYRIEAGRVVWSSEDAEFETARFVQDGDRVWIVTVHTADKKTILTVYDAYSQAQDQTAVRTLPVAESKVYMSNSGVVFHDGKAFSRYYPRNGLRASLKLPEGARMVSPTQSGYLIAKDKQIMVVNSQKGGWTTKGKQPVELGFTDKATVKELSVNPSVSALLWTEEDRNAIAFVNTQTGNQIATWAGVPEEDDLNRIRNAEGAPFVFFNNLVINVSDGTIYETDAPVRGIVDNIVYMDDGSGIDVYTQEPVWKTQDNAEAPLLFAQRKGYYVEDETLYAFGLKGKSKSQEDEPKEKSEDG